MLSTEEFEIDLVTVAARSERHLALGWLDRDASEEAGGS